MVFIHIGLDLRSQTNGDTQVKLTEIEWGLDGTPTKENFSKLFLATNFHSTIDPLVLKFVSATSKRSKKKKKLETCMTFLTS